MLEGKHRFLYVSFGTAFAWSGDGETGSRTEKSDGHEQILGGSGPKFMDRTTEWHGARKGEADRKEMWTPGLYCHSDVKRIQSWWYVALYALGSTYEGSPLRWDLEIFRNQLKRTASTEFPESPLISFWSGTCWVLRKQRFFLQEMINNEAETVGPSISLLLQL